MADRVCPRCGKPEFATGDASTVCMEADCYWRTVPVSIEPEGRTELIPALDDAQIRLACFHAGVAAAGSGSFASALTNAKELYNWIMDDEPEGEVEPAPLTPEDQCERRH